MSKYNIYAYSYTWYREQMCETISIFVGVRKRREFIILEPANLPLVDKIKAIIQQQDVAE